MGRIKSKRRLPVTACNSSQSPILDNTQGAAAAAATTTANCTRKSTQKLISRFHVLNKELARLKSDVDKTTMITSKRIIEIQDEMDSMGGLHAYQKASLKGGNENTGKGYSGKWVAPFLKEIWKTSSTPFFSSSSNIQPQPPKFRLLDVGALNGDTYTAYHNWMCVESIDLNPQNPLKVKRQDFFKRPLPLSVTTTTTTLHQDTFDCVSRRDVGERDILALTRVNI